MNEARRGGAGRGVHGIAFLGLALSCHVSNDVTRPLPAGMGAAEDTVAPVLREDKNRLPDNAVPERYALDFVIDPEKDRFDAEATLEIELLEPSREILLNARDLAFTEILFVRGGERRRVTWEPLQSTTGIEDEVRIRLGKLEDAGAASLQFRYSAPIQSGLTGLYRVVDDSGVYAFTQFQPADARRVFPCFDEPQHKTPFRLRVTVPKGNRVFANTRLAELSIDEETGQQIHQFRPTLPLPTYLVALAIGPLEQTTSPGAAVPLSVITTPTRAHLAGTAIETASEHLDLLTEYFGIPYPYDKLDLVAVPDFAFGAMENASLISFREERILVDPEQVSPDATIAMAETIAHEISHHWFGNFVTPAWWDDLWLNEGFATWIEAKIVDRWRPELEVDKRRLTSKLDIMELDALPSALPVRRRVASSWEAESAFSGIVYDKGAGVIDMLEAWLGEDTFQRGVRRFIADHPHGSATSAELFEVMARESGRPVADVATSFLDQPGVPIVTASLACEPGLPPRVTLEQDAFGQSPLAKARWKIPVCLALSDRSSMCTLLHEQRATVELEGDCPRWVYPNADERGYYRSSVDDALLARLTADVASLDPRLQIGVLRHLWATVEQGAPRLENVFELLGRLVKQTDPEVIGQVTLVLLRLHDLTGAEDARIAFEKRASALLLPTAKRLGFRTRDDDAVADRLVRRRILSALSVLAPSDPWLKREADQVTNAFLAGGGEGQALDDNLAIALRISARSGDDKLLADLRRVQATAATPQERIAALGGLSAFADRELLERALMGLLSGEIKKQDASYLVRGAMAFPASRSLVRRFLRDNFDALRARLPDVVLVRLLVAFDTLCSPAERTAAASFATGAYADVDAASDILTRKFEMSDQCIAVSDRIRPALHKELGL